MFRPIYRSSLISGKRLGCSFHLKAIKRLQPKSLTSFVGLTLGFSLLGHLPVNATTFSVQRQFGFGQERDFDRFGSSVAIGENYAIIGSSYHNGGRGAAYVYDTSLNEPLWRLTPNDSVTGGEFGISVDVSGNYGLIGGESQGSNSSGAAYLYDLSTGSQLQKLTPFDSANGDLFGVSVALQNNYALVGARHNTNRGINYAGAAYVFNLTTGTQTKLVANDAKTQNYFGQAVDLDGGYAIVGSRNSGGSAYIYDINTGNQLWKLTPPNPSSFFGSSVSISGNYALVGAQGESAYRGAAYLFDLRTGKSIYRFTSNTPTRYDSFGASVSLNGNYALIGASGTSSAVGAAYLFDITTGSLVQKLTANNGLSSDFFGSSVALNNNQILVGANGVQSSRGSGYLYSQPLSPTLQLASLATAIPTSIVAQTSTGAAVPEPLTILGSGTAIAFGVGFKKKLAQKQEPKNKNK